MEQKFKLGDWIRYNGESEEIKRHFDEGIVTGIVDGKYWVQNEKKGSFVVNVEDEDKYEKVKLYYVEITAIYNGALNIRATSQKDALEIVKKMLNDDETTMTIPDFLELPFADLNFGEITADYAEELK